MNKKSLTIIVLILVIAAAGWWYLNYSSWAQEKKLAKVINQEMSGVAIEKEPVGGEETIAGNWKIISLVKNNEMIDLFNYDSQIAFTGDAISGKICNNLNGQFTIVEGNNIVANGGIVRTEMACEANLMEVENIILNGLEKGIGYGLNANTMTLTGNNGEVIGLVKAE